MSTPTENSSTKQAQHTPTPWHRNIPPAYKYPTIFAGRNTHVARVVCESDTTEAEQEANADFIVRAVNSHAALVDALEYVRATLMACGNGNGVTIDMAGTIICMTKLNGALAIARGEKVGAP